MKRFVVPFVALLAAALIGGVASVGLWEAVDDDTVPAAATATATVNRPVAVKSGSVADIYEQTIPGVVEITAQSAAAGQPGGGGTATGSGWVLDSEGHIVTNQHVVDGASEVTVKFHDGTEIQADVVGTDPSSDVALLKLNEIPEDLQPLERGSSESLRIGDPVVAIGSPFGLEGTVTAGIVSAKNRQLQAPNSYTIDGAIQTDAALNHGNSGGPLLDFEGRVVGMNSQIASESGGNVGIGYAVPIETIERGRRAAEVRRLGASTPTSASRSAMRRAVARRSARCAAARLPPTPASRRATSSPSSTATRSATATSSAARSPRRSPATRSS